MSRKLRPRKLRPQTLKTETPRCLENSDPKTSDPLGVSKTQTRKIEHINTMWIPQADFFTVRRYSDITNICQEKKKQLTVLDTCNDHENYTQHSYSTSIMCRLNFRRSLVSNSSWYRQCIYTVTWGKYNDPERLYPVSNICRYCGVTPVLYLYRKPSRNTPHEWLLMTRHVMDINLAYTTTKRKIYTNVEFSFHDRCTYLTLKVVFFFSRQIIHDHCTYLTLWAVFSFLGRCW